MVGLRFEIERWCWCDKDEGWCDEDVAAGGCCSRTRASLRDGATRMLQPGDATGEEGLSAWRMVLRETRASGLKPLSPSTRVRRLKP